MTSPQKVAPTRTGGPRHVKMRTAAVLAPLLSIVIFSGILFQLIALRRNRSAALRSRLGGQQRKSTVAPALSMARYRYVQGPLTRTEVSSIRQLGPTGRLRA
jgi:hypothetical protein